MVVENMSRFGHAAAVGYRVPSLRQITNFALALQMSVKIDRGRAPHRKAVGFNRGHGVITQRLRAAEV